MSMFNQIPMPSSARQTKSWCYWCFSGGHNWMTSLCIWTHVSLLAGSHINCCCSTWIMWCAIAWHGIPSRVAGQCSTFECVVIFMAITYRQSEFWTGGHCCVFAFECIWNPISTTWWMMIRFGSRVLVVFAELRNIEPSHCQHDAFETLRVRG